MKDREVNVYKANYLLQAKVGKGPLNKQIIEECQKIMDENDFDFGPMAEEYLTIFQQLIDEGRNTREPAEDLTDRMTAVAMQLKANAAMFRYPDISKLAIIMLWLLESIDELDEDALDIAQAHHDALQTILEIGLREGAQASGHNFEKELKSACERYFHKMKISPQNVFYVEF